MHRRLATIVIADVVGYSALIHADEAGTRTKFKALAADVVAPLTATHSGRLIKTMGDAFFWEFASAVEAVSFAAELQEWIGGASDDTALILGIGINLGDVIVEDDDIHGEGVNIAARLEPIAAPGGVCVSAKVYDEVRGKLDLIFTDGGEHELKNIAEPVRVYHLGGDGAVLRIGRKARVGDKKPLINVQPIKVIGKGEDVAELAEGLHEAMIAGLTAFNAFEVSRDQDANRADLVIEGGVRGSGNRVRASISLHDRAKGVEVWAQRYDGTFDDVLELEDQISSSVIAVIHHRIKLLDSEFLENASNDDLTVTQLLSKAGSYLTRSPGDNAPAQEALAAALEQDPDNSMANAMMACCIWRIAEFSPLAITPDDAKLMQSHIDRALQSDPRSYFALVYASIIREDLFGDYYGSLDYVERALQLNPNYNPARGSLAIARWHIDGTEGNIDALTQIIGADPVDPFRFRLQRELCLALLAQGDPAKAADVMRRLLQQAPAMGRNVLIAVGIYGLAGQKDAAKKCASSLLAQFPDLAISTMRKVDFRDGAQKERFQDALKDAGLPD